MKRIFLFLPCFVVFSCVARAANFSWIGASGGKWSDPANWSASVPGSIPGPGDDIILYPGVTNSSKCLIDLDVSPTVASITIGLSYEATLVTSRNASLTITRSLTLYGSLIDSTSEDVRFDLVFDGASGSSISVITQPISLRFAGRVPVSSGNGATFSLINNGGLVIDNLFSLVFAQNSGEVATTTTANLRFRAGSGYVLDNKLDGAILAATWDPAKGLENPKESQVVAPLITIRGDIRTIRHPVNTQYGSITLDLYALSNDFDFGLPNGTVLSGDLIISNTNNHILTLLNAVGDGDSVTVKVPGYAGRLIGGNFNMTGAATNVSMARAAAPFTSYRLEVREFYQAGGNFSLQDAQQYTGSSTLTIKQSFNETAGTFLTNSAAAAPARFAVDFVGPNSINNSSGLTIYPHQITAAGGVMNSPANEVTVRISDIPFTYGAPGGPRTSLIGATLNSSLQVGRLELNGGPVIAGTNTVTVTNPGRDAVKITAGNSYVNGLVRRATNSTGPYMMPTGKGTQLAFTLDTCLVIPASATPSVYEAEYFNTQYSDPAVALPFKGIDATQYWNIGKVSGADAQVQLVLTKAVPGAVFTDNLVVAHYTGGAWAAEQGSILSPGNAATGSVLSKVLSSFSPFTFGYGAFTNAPLPVHLLGFSAHAENGAARLDWKVADAPDRFEVLRSADGIAFSQVGMVSGSSGMQQYSYLDSRTLTGRSFYRLRTVEKGGNFSLSNIILLNSTGQAANVLMLAPTVIRSSGSLRIQAERAGQVQLTITGIDGRNWKKQQLLVQAGITTSLVDFSYLPAGTYQISAYFEGQQMGVIRFVKEN